MGYFTKNIDQEIKYNVKNSFLEKITKNNRFPDNGKMRVTLFFSELWQIKNKIKSLQCSIIALLALFSPILTFAQVPNLGAAYDFVIYTPNGALGNTGISNINGNIGTHNGAITGFGAPTVVHGNIDSVDAITAQCAIDVQAAYNEIFSTPATVVGHAAAFGAGETLPEGVYSIGGAGSVGASLTLDAEGNSDAIFIFKFGGAFTTGASTTINLINGALSSNVFWIAEGAIALAASTDMKGTLIASNGAISMGAGGLLEGRLLSTAGAASIYAVTANTPHTVTPLPIELLSFTGLCEKQNTILLWETASELNNNHFTVEHSTGGIQWSTVGTVKGAGNSNTQLNYSLKDITLRKKSSYYRLKQSDHNGDYEYVDVIFINNCKKNEPVELTVYPNPTSGKFILQSNSDSKEINSIEIHNSQGQKVYSSDGNQTSFDLSNNISGCYFISVMENSELTHLKLILDNESNNR